ncbi:MAG: hypothetical protein M3094_09725 [Actinomycetia bacterium]|nr:hypothetical protein [Actinomycetes bacterium]
MLTNVRVAAKDGWDTDRAIQVWIADHVRALGDRGRILVRPSGTAPLIRVMVEAPTESEATSIAESIAGVVEVTLG